MKAAGGVAALTAAALICWSGDVEAYRPFDGTDAAVAETGEIEIELGPVEYLRAAAERTLLAPDLRINYGFIPGWEAALEGKLAHGLTAGVPGTSLLESQALLKGVLREGSLQEKPGPSIATEFGVLLPGIDDQHGTGSVLKRHRLAALGLGNGPPRRANRANPPATCRLLSRHHHRGPT